MRARFSEKRFHSDRLLIIRGLSKSFGDRKLFDNVELKVTGGERIALSVTTARASQPSLI